MSGSQSGDRADRALQDYVNLITKHQNALRRFIVSLAPGSPEVDDILQETNIILWEKRAQFEPGSNFLAWAMTIAKYQVLRFRSTAGRSRILYFSDEFIIDLADRLTPKTTGSALMAALDHCMDKLDAEQRQLLTIRYTSGTSLKEHAAERGTTAEVLRVTLHRIRKMLKQCIEMTLQGQST